MNKYKCYYILKIRGDSWGTLYYTVMVAAELMDLRRTFNKVA